jgi:NAD(P)-dependent dehydrogenase (short-subunit alcohol dehydrogenase family)
VSQPVVITGASAGVGRPVAHAYAARGARLGLLALWTSTHKPAVSVAALGGLLLAAAGVARRLR